MGASAHSGRNPDPHHRLDAGSGRAGRRAAAARGVAAQRPDRGDHRTEGRRRVVDIRRRVLADHPDHADRRVQFPRPGAHLRAFRGARQADRRLPAALRCGRAAHTRRLARRRRLACHRQPRARRQRHRRKAVSRSRHAPHAQERRQHALLAGHPAVRARHPECLRPGRFARSGQGDGDQVPRRRAEHRRCVPHRLCRLADRQGAGGSRDQHPRHRRRRSGRAAPGNGPDAAHFACRRHDRADPRVRAGADRGPRCAQDRSDLATCQRHAGHDPGGSAEYRRRGADSRRHLLRHQVRRRVCSSGC